MKKLFKLLTIIFLILLSNSIFSQDNPFIDVGHLGGEIKCSAIKDDYAFLGQANYFVVVDKLRENFEKKAELRFKETLEGMFLLDDYIYLVSDSLFIIDITNPLDPVLVSKTKLDEPSNKIFVEGGYAYIARFGSISVVDISDVNSPQAISIYVTGQQTDDLFIKGKYLYTIDIFAEKLFIYNVEDKSNLTLVNLFNSPNPTSIDIVGDYLYLTTQKYPDIGLNIFDITNPELPIKKGFIETKTVVGNHTYFRNPVKVKVKGNTAYIITSFGYFFIINISDKTNPVELSNLSVFNVYSSVFSMDIDESKVYLALFSLGFKEIDVSDSLNPSVSNELNEVCRINWMQADSNYFVASSRNGLWIYDNKPEKPVLIKQYREWINISHFFLENNKIIAIMQDSIIIIDITDPSNASELSSYKPIAHTNELFASGDYVFLTINGEKKTFEILDISDPQNPNQLSSIEIPGVANDIFVDNNKNKVFLTYRLDDTNYGYIIIDISNLSSPSILSDVKTNGIPSPIFAQGDSLYVGSNTGEIDNPVWNLEIFEISNANSPTSVASTSGEGNIWDIEVFGETIFAGVAGQSLYEMLALPDGTIDMLDVSHSLSTIGIDIYNRDGFYEIYTLEGYKYDKYGEEQTKGSGGVRKKKKKKKDGGRICCVTFGIEPAKAASDGCKTTPDECKSGGCGKELNIEAIPTSDWLFYKWSGAISSSKRKEKISYKDKPCQPGTTCENVAIANFTPWFLIKGESNSFECPITTNGNSYKFGFALQASLPDDWLVTSIKIKISGDDKVLRYLQKAVLNWWAKYELDGKGAGVYKFQTENLIIAKGTTENLYLELFFNEMTDLKCPFDPMSIQIEIKPDYIVANPTIFMPGIVIGQVKGERKIGCINNEIQEKQYSSIQLAVDGANENEIIFLCSGIYEENVVVDKKINILSYNGNAQTIVEAASNEKPVFSLEADGSGIYNLTISGSNKAGIKIDNSNCAVEQCIIKENHTGVLVSEENSGIISNKIIYNDENGIELSGKRCKNTNVIYNIIGIENEEEAAPNDNGIYITNESSNNIIQKNHILGNKNAGILISNSSYNTIDENIIGFISNSFGSIIVIPNGKNGISIGSNCLHNKIENNMISGNGENGIKITRDSRSTYVSGNYIGTDGKKAIPNGENGISINGKNNKITNNNIISGNRKNGIKIELSTGHNSIEGNYIGTDEDGEKAIPNEENGISINGYFNEITNRNVISGNRKNGIKIEDKKSDIIIEGNYIGINKDGKKAIPNGENGISIYGDKNHIHKNIISGNVGNGILLSESAWHNMINNNSIGLNRDKNHALGNENGITIDNGGYENVLIENTISGNIKSGIKLVDCEKNKIEKNKIGIGKSLSYVFPNENGISIFQSNENKIANKNKISGNRENGIFLYDSHGNIVNNNYIGTHNLAFSQKTGVNILKGLNETITNNTIVNNCVGIKILDSRQSNIANNYLYHNTCHSSAIHLENSGGKISGNNITKDEGDAINCSKGSNPFVVKNNIFDNNGFALNNKDANVHIIAQNNWWGENTDPNASINGDVDYTNWSSVSNDLVIATEFDTAYTAPSQSDSLSLYYRNLVYDMDSIDVTIVDSLGWIDSLSQSTFIFPDSLGGSNIVYFSVPDVPQGTIDKVIVKAISLIDTSWTNIDSFFIRAYFRALSRIDITPDTTVSLVLFDSLQFNAIGLDSFDNFFPAELVWSCTGGEIDSTGLYRATETGSFDILVSNTDSSIWAKTEVIVLPVGTTNPMKPKNDLILYQNYPNPFGDKTTIKFTLNKSGNTSLTIYDFMGNKRKTLTNRWYPEGTYEVDIKEKSLASGQYFYVLKQGNKRVVKKMVVY